MKRVSRTTLVCLALALPASIGRAEELYYVYRSGARLGLAEIVVDRPAKRIVSERSLWEADEAAAPLELRVSPKPRRVVLVLDRADADNVVIVEPASTPGRRIASLGRAPFAVTFVGGHAYVASETAVADPERAPEGAAFRPSDGFVLRALAGVPARAVLLVASSADAGGARVDVLSAESLSPAGTIELGSGLERPDRIAVEPRGRRALVASSVSGRVAALDLKTNTVVASFDTGVEAVAALCPSGDDGALIEAFPARGTRAAAIDLSRAAVTARFDAVAGPARPFYLDAPELTVASGAGAAVGLLAQPGKDGKVKLAAIELPSAPSAIGAVQREACIQVVAAAHDVEGRPALFLLDVVKRVRNHSRPALGEVLLMATDLDR